METSVDASVSSEATQQRVLQLLERMDARLTRLEAAVAQVPALAAAATDTLDTALARVAARGVDVDAHLQASVSALEVLTRPEMARLIGAVAARSAALEESLAMLSDAPALAATAADTVDAAVAQLAAQGVDVDARLRASLAAAELLTRPETVALLEQAIAQAGQVEALAAAAVDTADGLAASLAAQGVSVDERLRTSLTALEVLTRPETVRLLSTTLSRSGDLAQLMSVFLESGVFAPDSARIIGRAGAALVETQSEPPQQLSAFGLFRSLSDPDVQRAASFAIRFARRFGRILHSNPTP